MTHDLRFRTPLSTSHPVDLIFGAEEGGGGDAALVTFSIALQAPTLSITASSFNRYDVEFNVSLPAPTLIADAVYDLALSTGPQGSMFANWQEATRLSNRRVEIGFQQAVRIDHLVETPWQKPDNHFSEAEIPWQENERAPAQTHARWQDAERSGATSRQVRWQEMDRDNRPATDYRWQEATPVSIPTRRVRWQEMGRDSRPTSLYPWGSAALLDLPLHSGFDQGTAIDIGLIAPWQEARKPPNGRSRYDIPEPPVEPPCYTPPPGQLAHLIFAGLSDRTTRLLFTCRVDGAPAQFVIPIRRVYMAVHDIECVRLPDLTQVPILGASLSADAESFGWTLQATGPTSLLDLLSPAAGEPARIRLTLDGVSWVFVVEGIRRERRFGQARVQITGRSLTALLGEPYSVPSMRLNGETRTARQLVEDALQYTGATLDWAVTDWLVGEGAWSFSGTPLAAALRVAQSIGAVVQSHLSDAQLIVMPRYPLPPWEWHQAVPDVQLPLAAVVMDGFERVDSPGYNGVYVSGESQGVLGFVRRTGTAGDVLAPMVTDPLITHADAARQRGTAILGAAGPRARVSLTLPVLTGGSLPGVLRVGQLVEVVEPGDTWRGLVRGVDVQAGLPRVRQTVVLERSL